MRARLFLVPILAVAVAAGAWMLVPARASAPASPALRDAASRRVDVSAEDGGADDDGGRPRQRADVERADALQDSRDAIMDALHDQLDALDAEVGLDDDQHDHLETVLTEERSRGFETLDALRRGPRPGEPLPDGKAIAEKMQASRIRADTEARAVLDDTQYAAWQRLREPKARRQGP